MLTDYWAHRFVDEPKLLEEVEDEDFNLDEVLANIEADDWELIGEK